MQLENMNVVSFVFVLYYAVSILPVDGPPVKRETHSLSYIYTTLSEPVGLPGIHQFSAMGLLDGRMIDYFDSEHRKKVPKQDWMKERLDPGYWVNGTLSCLHDQQWFKDNLDILMKRIGHNDSDLHVLQWMRGCEGNMQPDGSITFHRGKNIYTYDGNDFLSFDDTNKVWVAATEAANETKKEWGNQVLTGYRLYVENECMDLLSEFVDYQQTHLQNALPPEVFMFSKDTKVETKVMLTCLATGFYPKDVILNIKRNGRVLIKEDGVVTSGVRPNDDDTFQRRDSVEILRRDTSTFTCEVNHPASRLHVEKEWDHKLHSGPEGLGPIIAGVLVVIGLITMAVGLVLLYKKGVFDKFTSGANTSYAAVNDGSKPAQGGQPSSVITAHAAVNCGSNTAQAAVNGEAKKAKGSGVTVNPKGSHGSLSSIDSGFPTAVNDGAKKAKGSEWSLSSSDSGVPRSGWSLSVTDFGVFRSNESLCSSDSGVSRSDWSLSVSDFGVFRNSVDNKNSCPESQSLLGQNEESQPKEPEFPQLVSHFFPF